MIGFIIIIIIIQGRTLNGACMPHSVADISKYGTSKYFRLDPALLLYLFFFLFSSLCRFPPSFPSQLHTHIFAFMKSYGSTPAALPQYTVKRNEILSRTERDLLQVDRPGYGSHNKLEVAFNLVNATVGAGIIGLPFAIYNAGFVFGIVVSILVAIVSQLGLYMLIAAGQRVGVYKFAGLVEYLMGRPGYHLLNIIMLVQTLGVCVSYFICKFFFFLPSVMMTILSMSMTHMMLMFISAG